MIDTDDFALSDRLSVLDCSEVNPVVSSETSSM